MANSDKKPIAFVVDDDKIWLEIIAKHLEKIGYSVTKFESGSAMLKQLDQKPAFITLDYHIPKDDIEGIELLRKALKIYPEAQIVMFSGQEEVQVAIDTLHYGAYDYIAKGENTQHRLTIIDRNLRRTREAQEKVLELTVRVKRWQLALGAMIAGLLLFILALYLYICPYQRSLKWDPFGRANWRDCGVLNLIPGADAPAPQSKPAK